MIYDDFHNTMMCGMMSAYGYKQSAQAILREHLRRLLAGVLRHGDDDGRGGHRLCALAATHEAPFAVPHAPDSGVREEFQ